MLQGIGEIITRLRIEEGFTQPQLCAGICSVPELVRMEKNQLIPGHFMLDRLFSRLGKSTERLEYVLSQDVYEFYELRYWIQTAVIHRNWTEAERLLERYEKKKQADIPLHRQFVEQERAQIAWMRGGNTEEILELLEQAIARTILSDESLYNGNALSAEELKLMLFRWEVSRGTVYERAETEVRRILFYMDSHSIAKEEKIRVYPYAALLLADLSDVGKNVNVAYLIEHSLELLRECGGVLYMPEILEQYTLILESRKEKEETIAEFRSMRRSLLKLEEEYDVHLEKYRLFHYMNRAFELDYEIIRQSRKRLGMSQEELAWEICSPETVSRIESGKRSPSNRNMEKMLAKMDRERYRINMMIAAERYEQLALEREIVVRGQRFEYDEADRLVEELEKQLDMDIVENRQYIMTHKICAALRKGTLSREEGIEQLYQALYLTLKEKENIFTCRLTHQEFYILSAIGAEYHWNKNNEKAIQIWRELIRNCEESEVGVFFRFRDWAVTMGNLAGLLEDLYVLDEPLKLCKRRLEIELNTGKGSDLGRGLAISACVLEKQHQEACIPRFRQALDILKLMKQEYRYQCNKEYLKEKGLLDKVEMLKKSLY